jgi:hypothetical protein
VEYVLDPRNQETSIWTDEVQHAVICNFITLLRILNNFNARNASTLLLKFSTRLEGNGISENTFAKALFNIMYDPEQIIKHFNRDFLSGEELNEYITLFVNFHALSREARGSPIDMTFEVFEAELELKLDRLINYICQDETAEERKIKLLLSMIKRSYDYDLKHNSSG